MVFEVILNCNSLDELLDSGSADEYPDTFGRKTHIERYRELAKKFAQFPVEMGAMQAAIKEWMDEIQETLIQLGASPEQARSILPNSLKTEIVVTMNLREWRHFFKLRTSKRAHPQMREISIPLLKKMQDLLPTIFDDIQIEG